MVKLVKHLIERHKASQYKIKQIEMLQYENMKLRQLIEYLIDNLSNTNRYFKPR